MEGIVQKLSKSASSGGLTSRSSTPRTSDMVERMRQRLTTGQSLGFEVDKDQTSEEDDGDTRRMLRALVPELQKEGILTPREWWESFSPKDIRTSQLQQLAKVWNFSKYQEQNLIPPVINGRADLVKSLYRLMRLQAPKPNKR